MSSVTTKSEESRRSTFDQSAFDVRFTFKVEVHQVEGVQECIFSIKDSDEIYIIRYETELDEIKLTSMIS